MPFYMKKDENQSIILLLSGLYAVRAVCNAQSMI